MTSYASYNRGGGLATMPCLYCVSDERPLQQTLPTPSHPTPLLKSIKPINYVQLLKKAKYFTHKTFERKGESVFCDKNKRQLYRETKVSFFRLPWRAAQKVAEKRPDTSSDKPLLLLIATRRPRFLFYTLW